MRRWIVRLAMVLAMLAVLPATLYGCPGCSGSGSPPPVIPDDPDGRILMTIEDPVVDNGDTTYTFVTRIEIYNEGNVQIDSAQIVFDLEIPFEGYTFSGDSVWTNGYLTLNGSYDGDADSLVLTGADSLPITESEIVWVRGTVAPVDPWIGPFTDVQTSLYFRFDGQVFTDTATDTLNIPPPEPPDPVPGVQITKSVDGMAGDNGDSSFTTSMLLTVENIGNVSLDSVQIREDLGATFAPYTLITIDSTWADNLTLNGGYDGVADSLVLSGNDEIDGLLGRAA